MSRKEIFEKNAKLISETYEGILRRLQEKIWSVEDSRQRAYLLRIYNFFQARGFEIVAKTFIEILEENSSDDKLP